MSEKFPAIPDPQISPESHQTVLLALKEAVELLVGTRGRLGRAAVSDVASLETQMSGALSLLEARLVAIEAKAALQWERIASINVTAVAAIDVLWTTGHYQAIEVILTGILPATLGDSNTNMLVRARRSGSFLDGASAYNTQVINQASTTLTNTTFDASGWFFNRGGFAVAADQMSGRAMIDPGGTNLEPGMIGRFRHSSVADGRKQQVVAGSIPVQGAIDGLRFLWVGNVNFVASGNILVMGLRV